MNFIHLLRIVLLKFNILLLLQISQSFKLRIELTMPWVKDHRLKCECTCANYKTCNRKISSKESHN